MADSCRIFAEDNHLGNISPHLEQLSLSMPSQEIIVSDCASGKILRSSEQRDIDARIESTPGNSAGTPDIDKIKIIVGTLHRVFLIPRLRICSISPYISSIFASTPTLQVILPDVEPEIFQLVLNWLENDEFASGSNQGLQLDQLIDIYLFGDLISCCTLKNYAMDLIQDDMYLYMRHHSPGIRFSLNQIRRIFAETIFAADAPIRKFVAALVSYRLIFGATPERLKPIFEVPGFLQEFAAFQSSSLKELNGEWYRPVSLREDPRKRGFHDAEVSEKGFHICTFHVHEKGERCLSISNQRRKGRDEDAEDIHQGRLSLGGLGEAQETVPELKHYFK
ncbi:hypothetical protein BUE80_DR012162 [Diplocarpon rosae]|nr:hypothetical protein BUE80_DR012162 [Diplocarpon rosae]